MSFDFVLRTKLCLAVLSVIVVAVVFFIIFNTLNLLDILVLNVQSKEQIDFVLQTLSLSFLGAVLWLFIPSNCRNLLFIFILVTFVIILFFNLQHIAIFGKRIGYFGMLSILNTYNDEVFEFANKFISFKSFVMVGVLSLIPLFFIKIVNFKLILSYKRFIIFFSSIYLLFVFNICLIYDSLVLDNYPAFRALVDFYDYHVAQKDDEEYNFKNVKDLNPQILKKLYVVIITDSVKRDEMSLYSNNLKTTPFFDSVKNDLLIFHDVSASTASTNMMINNMMRKDEINKSTLIDFFNQAGFKTYWLSAHARYGVYDRYASIVNSADYVKYINANKFSGDTENFKKDDLLLPEIESALADQADKKIIFIHLMGAHMMYKNRLPEKYLQNDPDDLKLNDDNRLLDEYKDYAKALRFGDEILEKIYNLIWRKYKDYSSYILYLSDHADMVSKYDDSVCFCHNADIKDASQLEVPFVLWMSEKYKNTNAEFVKNFRNYLNRPYEVDLLFHSVIDLSRFESYDLDKSKSIFNKQYEVRKRNYDTIKKPL